MPIQLPSDAEARGHKETRPFHHPQVFHTPARNFTDLQEQKQRGAAPPSRQALDASASCRYPRLSRRAASRAIPLRQAGALTGFPAHWRGPSKVAYATF